MRGPPRTWRHHVDGVVHWYMCVCVLALAPTVLQYILLAAVYAACHHVGAGSISPENDGALLGQTAKRFHPPTSWVSTLARRWEWVWTCKNVEKKTQLCPVLLEPNWSWTRSDKMRGEILRLGSNLGWPPNGTCVLTAGSVAGTLSVGLPCVPILYLVPYSLWQRTRRQQGCSSNTQAGQGAEQSGRCP